MGGGGGHSDAWGPDGSSTFFLGSAARIGHHLWPLSDSLRPLPLVFPSRGFSSVLLDPHPVPCFQPPTESAPRPQERGSARASWSGVPGARAALVRGGRRGLGKAAGHRRGWEGPAGVRAVLRDAVWDSQPQVGRLRQPDGRKTSLSEVGHGRGEATLSMLSPEHSLPPTVWRGRSGEQVTPRLPPALQSCRNQSVLMAGGHQRLGREHGFRKQVVLSFSDSFAGQGRQAYF